MSTQLQVEAHELTEVCLHLSLKLLGVPLGDQLILGQGLCFDLCQICSSCLYAAGCGCGAPRPR